jgi:hypothetical protein
MQPTTQRKAMSQKTILSASKVSREYLWRGKQLLQEQTRLSLVILLAVQSLYRILGAGSPEVSSPPAIPILAGSTWCRDDGQEDVRAS